MMENLFQHEFRLELVNAVRALSEVVATIGSDPEAAIAAARATAKSLQERAQMSGYPQITAAAVPVEAAPVQVVGKLVQRLIRVLEEVVAAGWEHKVNVLVVEGFSKLGLALRKKLSAPNREVLVASTAADAERMLDEHEVALVVLDLVLPDMDGRSLLSRLREDPRTESVPVVVLADAGGQQLKSECFALGADQYFEKSSDTDMLAVAIASSLHRSLTKNRDTRFDVETGLLNRDGLRKRLERTLAKAARKRTDVCLALLDFSVDCLDDLPHEQFDGLSALVVGQAAKAIKTVLRPDDVLARWGDLEVVALLPRTTREGATRALTRVHESLDSEVFRQHGASFRVDFATGLVQIEGPLPLDAVMAEADRVLLADREKRRVLAAPTSALPKQRIVVVDADQELAFKLRRKLVDDGFEVRFVRNGSNAMEVALAGRTSLILLESRLPGVDAFELLRRMRHASELETVPILMTATLGRDLDVAHAFELGADDYILKPCSTASLVARVRRHLKRSATHSGSGVIFPGKAGAIAGLFTGDQLYEFVQMLGLNSKTGRLALGSDTVSGHIDFRRGKVVGAWTSRGKVALEATQVLLTMRSGRFEFWPGLDPAAEQQGILASVDTLLLDAMRVRDESSMQGE